jgi:hypothetical protein
VSQSPVLARLVCRSFVPLAYRLTFFVPVNGFGPLEYRSPTV